MQLFQFVDPGPLQDMELELVPLQAKWVDLVIKAASDPQTRRDAPADAAVTRQQLMSMVQSWPLGHQAGDADRGIVPAYHFWMKVARPVGQRGLFGHPDRFAIAGGIGLRIGHSSGVGQGQAGPMQQYRG